MSVLIETSLGDIVVDLEIDSCPRVCENFLKLCKIKYYGLNAFFNGPSNYSHKDHVVLIETARRQSPKTSSHKPVIPQRQEKAENRSHRHTIHVFPTLKSEVDLHRRDTLRQRSKPR